MFVIMYQQLSLTRPQITLEFAVAPACFLAPMVPFSWLSRSVFMLFCRLQPVQESHVPDRSFGRDGAQSLVTCLRPGLESELKFAEWIGVFVFVCDSPLVTL